MKDLFNMKYYFYLTKFLAPMYENELGFKINKNSKLDFNKNFSIASMHYMPSNVLDDSLHLLPIKFILSLPRESTNQSYSEIMDERAYQLVQHAKSKNKTITVTWSGGIDSTCVLVSLLKQNINDMLTVACTSCSIYENRKLFDDYLNNKVRIKYVQDIEYSPNSDTFLIRSVGADTLMGGDIHALFFYSYNDIILKPPSRDNFAKVMNFFIKIMSDYQIEILYNQIITSANKLGVSLETLWDFISFYDLTYKINSLYWIADHPHLFMLTPPKEHIQTLDDWSARFYMTPKFYSWGLYSATVDDRIGNNRFEFKKIMKDYIYDFNRDLNYYQNKTKVSSYGRNLIPSKYKNYLAIDENYNYIDIKNNAVLLEGLHKANEIKI